MRRFDYFRPLSLKEAWQLKEKNPGAKFVSGGTDIFVQIKNKELRPPALISLRSIPELAGVKAKRETRIGAMTTISEIIHSAELNKSYPVLAAAARRLGSVQVRNMATIGGNLCNCSPCADMAPPLLVLDAKVRLKTNRASRDLPLSEFFSGPGESCLASDEILTDVLLAPPRKNTKTIFLKKGRVRMDLAVASIAILLEMEGNQCRKARLAAGSVAPVPLRLQRVEALLEGAALTPALINEAQKLAEKSVSPISDVRSTKEYRRQIVGVFVKRGLEKILGGSQE